MELSNRMLEVVNMVTPGMRVADIGCDHGFVAIYLYEHKLAAKVYAMDVKTGPLKRAKEHIKECGFQDYIETRLSNGVQMLDKGEADAIICAGMGGKLMAQIIEEGFDKIFLMKELILQPQSDLFFFRKFLREHQLRITKESMVEEAGKFYFIIKATVSESPLPVTNDTIERLQDTFGPCLINDKNPLLKKYLEWQKEAKQTILAKLTDSHQSERVRELTQELTDINTCLSLLQF